LPTAADAIEKARSLADDDYNDKAYVQYLRASEITINLIPHHPDYRTASQRPDWYKEFADLLKAVRSKQGTMDAIKRDIIEDNLVSGMQPTGYLYIQIPRTTPGHATGP
jgi:ubiquitin carboxyl-terminal hydrolase 8